MSSDDTQAALSRAYELVMAERYDEAQAILDPILAADPDNADAWWIYAHAVTDPAAGHEALENVVRLDPNYPGAADLLSMARGDAPVPAPAAAPITPPAPPEAPPSLPEDELAEYEDEPFDIDSIPALQPSAVPPPPLEEEPESSGVNYMLIGLVVVVIVVVGIVLLLLTQSGGGPVVGPSVGEVFGTSTESGAAAATTEATAASSTIEATVALI